MTQSLTTEPSAPPSRPGPPIRPLPWRVPALSALSALPAWWPLALGLLLGLVGGTAYGLLATPRYTATSYVVAVPGAGVDAATALGFAQAYGRVATDRAVLTEARATAGMPVDELRAAVRSATSPDAPMVEITGTASSPDRAAAVSNAVANALTRTGNQAASSTGVQLSLFAPAFDPTEPTSPSLPLSVAVGVCAGGLVGGLALLAAPRGRRDPAFPGVPAPAAPSDPGDRGGSGGDRAEQSVPGPAAPATAPAATAPATAPAATAPAVTAAAKAAAAAAASVSAATGGGAAADKAPEERRRLGRRSAR
ncbi:hypothetical protein [Streptomyces sp. DH37]|uniref:hypothetical protein n=1 Tax=Streptomyces sp. DH37 TaxID=3040122 RepID=UPI002443351F|nr:hypothetical protein [Streptomyces sp. DH37]MDG9704671.1 hypothetical protein [Streptomyces sp. DH37]